MNEDRKSIIKVGAVAAVVLFSSIGGCMWGMPLYNVYEQRLAGEADFEKAEFTRRVRVSEAQAAFDAADLTARAEVRRAQGVAEANTIIAQGLGGPEGYLRWRYIEMLEETGRKEGARRDVIYIPTEAGIPILEAGKRE